MLTSQNARPDALRFNDPSTNWQAIRIELIVERNQLLMMAGSYASNDPQVSKITWGEET